MYAVHSPDQTYIGWENNTWNLNRGEELKIRPERERIKIKKINTIGKQVTLKGRIHHKKKTGLLSFRNRKNRIQKKNV